MLSGDEDLILAQLEEMTVPEIAEVLGANVNTIYARLRAARTEFEAAYARHRARTNTLAQPREILGELPVRKVVRVRGDCFERRQPVAAGDDRAPLLDEAALLAQPQGLRAASGGRRRGLSGGSGATGWVETKALPAQHETVRTSPFGRTCSTRESLVRHGCDARSRAASQALGRGLQTTIMWNAEQWSYRNRFEEVGRSVAEELRQAWIRREFPHATWRAVGRTGLFELLTVPREEHGQAFVLTAAAIEGFSKGSFDLGFVIPIIVHAFLGLPLLHRYRTPEIERHLPGLASGESVLAFAVTEPHGGSKALESRCKLSRSDDGGYRLDGKKWHITNAPHCTHVLAWVRHPELADDLVAVLVEASTPGVRRERIATYAASSSVVGAIDFDGVRVAPGHVLFLRGGAKQAMRDLFVTERSLGMIATIGIMETMMERSLAFASSREVGGTVILEHQHVQRRLADMATRLESIRALSQTLIAMLTAGVDPTQIASIAKVQCCRAVMENAIDAAQLAGTYGMLEEAQNTMVLLDGLGISVGGGTEEIHRTTVVRWLQKQASTGQLYREPTVVSPRPAVQETGSKNRELALP